MEDHVEKKFNETKKDLKGTAGQITEKLRKDVGVPLLKDRQGKSSEDEGKEEKEGRQHAKEDT